MVDPARRLLPNAVISIEPFDRTSKSKRTYIDNTQDKTATRNGSVSITYNPDGTVWMVACDATTPRPDDNVVLRFCIDLRYTGANPPAIRSWVHTTFATPVNGLSLQQRRSRPPGSCPPTTSATACSSGSTSSRPTEPPVRRAVVPGREAGEALVQIDPRGPVEQLDGCGSARTSAPCRAARPGTALSAGHRAASRLGAAPGARLRQRRRPSMRAGTADAAGSARAPRRGTPPSTISAIGLGSPLETTSARPDSVVARS